MKIHQLNPFRPVALILSATVCLSLLAITFNSNPVFGQGCPLCDNPTLCFGTDHDNFFRELRAKLADHDANFTPTPSDCDCETTSSPASTNQVVFLDFDFGIDSPIGNVVIEPIQYTDPQKGSILAGLEEAFARFDYISFTLDLPSGEFSRVVFNLSLIHI